MSLEELLNMEVTSVSKKPEKLWEAAAAVHVVTGETIRRSGALSIPEALRGIPGVEVARIDTSQYAITIRGFNGSVANKLLVLIDGRSVYTPLYSGVFWDAQDSFMEDLSRIEVIRGPGGTIWGANAVNGVINVISKPSNETQGLLITGGGGNEERGFAGVRYGGRLGTTGSFRVYGKYFDRSESARTGGDGADDGFHMGQGGFRADWSPTPRDRITVQGDAYDGNSARPEADETSLQGGNLLGRWTRDLSMGSNLQLQVYVDRTEREIPTLFGEKLDTYDLDFQHRFPIGSIQDVFWGAGYRVTRDAVDNSPFLAFLPPGLTLRLYTGFIQDELKLAGERVRVTIGSKFEHNGYTGFEYQPSVRLSWMPAEGHNLWGAVSRVVRDPSRIDRQLFIPSTPPFIIAGGPDFDSEVLNAFEAGYKTRPTARLSVSLAAFYNSYDNLRSFEQSIPAVVANGLEGRTYGAEVEATYQALKTWRLEAGYTLLRLQLRREPGSTDTTLEAQEGDSPRHQFYLRSWIDLPHGLEADATVRRVNQLPNQQVAAYTAYDLRLGWAPTQHLELALVGQNLSDPRHPEFGQPLTRREIERSLYAKATWRF